MTRRPTLEAGGSRWRRRGRRRLCLAVSLLVLVLAATTGAWAQNGTIDRALDELEQRPITAQLGAGVATFSEPGTSDMTDAGLTWNVATLLDLTRQLTLEAAYVGSTRRTDIQGIEQGQVVQNGLEALLRLGQRFTPGDRLLLTPYVTGGVGWSVFNLTGTDSPVPGLADDDGTISIPLGLGLAARYGRVSLDLRAMYRPTWADEMFERVYSGRFGGGLNTVSLGGSLGYAL